MYHITTCVFWPKISLQEICPEDILIEVYQGINSGVPTAALCEIENNLETI